MLERTIGGVVPEQRLHLATVGEVGSHLRSHDVEAMGVGEEHHHTPAGE